MMLAAPAAETVAAEPIVATNAAPADNQAQLFESLTFKSADGRSLPYRLLSPKSIEPGKKYPIVLFLHGAGERGTDNTKPLIHVVRELATPEMRERYPVFVLVPQCPDEKQWVDTPWSLDSHTMPEQPSESMQLAIELLKQSCETLPTDPERVYAVGLSMGGFGVWDLLQRHPQNFSGAIAICGGGDPAFANSLKEIPIWATHGDADTVVKVKRSRDMINAIRAAGGRPVYTEFPGVGHNSWKPTAENRMVWDWLFSQQRK